MITIICSGSRGDFQPYIALARALKQRGKEVRITAGPSQEAFVKSYGVEVFSIGMDVSNAGIDPKLLEAAGSSDNPLKMLLTFHKMKHLGLEIAKESFEACKGSELIIYHPGCAIGYFAAQEMGIPAIMASPFPIHQNEDYLSVVMYGKSKNTAIKRKLSYKLLYNMLWTAGKQSIKILWKEQYGKLPEGYGCTFDRQTTAEKPSLISCSNAIFKRPTGWSDHIYQEGYWFLEEEAYTPEERVVNFLKAGEQPVYVGFGSMLKDEEKATYASRVIEALQKVNKRGILYGFGEIHNLPDTMITVQTTPHAWLFEQVSAVCHHGGAGTSAEGFRVGVPSIIVPFSNDQFAWAYRAYDLGIGSKPIPKKDLTAEKLVHALQEAFKPACRQQAKRISEQIKAEKGLDKVTQVICNLCDTYVEGESL